MQSASITKRQRLLQLLGKEVAAYVPLPNERGVVPEDAAAREWGWLLCTVLAAFEDNHVVVEGVPSSPAAAAAAAPRARYVCEMCNVRAFDAVASHPPGEHVVALYPIGIADDRSIIWTNILYPAEVLSQEDAWLNVRFDHDEAGALVIPHTRAVAAPRRGLTAYTTCDKMSVELRLANQVGAITLADGDEPAAQTASDVGSETGSAGRARGRAPMSRKRRQTLDSSLSSTRVVGNVASDSASSVAGGAGRPLPSTTVRAQIGAELQAKARAAGVSALPAGAVNGIVTPQPLPRNAGAPAPKRVAAAVASNAPAPPPSLASIASASDTASASARLSARDKYRNRKAQSRGVPVTVPVAELAMSPAHEMVAVGRGVDGDEDVDVGDVNDLLPRAPGAGVARAASRQVARPAVPRGAPISEVPLTVEQVFAWVSRSGLQAAGPVPAPSSTAQTPSEPSAVLAAQSGWHQGLIGNELARYTTLSGSVVSCVLPATAHIRQSLSGAAGSRSGAPAYTQLAVAPFVTRW